MEAIVINHYGDAKQLTAAEISMPEITADQVLVKLHATSVNPIDWKMRTGLLKDAFPFHFPITLGWDAAGTIEAIGENVHDFNVGDAVFARPDLSREGTYAEYTAINQDKLAKKPANISFSQAAAVPLAGLTAWQTIHNVLKLQSGANILITGGSGGVGCFAIQLANLVGAHVTTTASPNHSDFVKSLGAETVIDYHETRPSETLKDFDAVLDLVGGDALTDSYKVLKTGGHVASIVENIDNELMTKLKLVGHHFWLEPKGTDLQQLAELLAANKLQVPIARTLPFSEIGLNVAHRLSETGHVQGKIVIQMHND
ncbi:NADP-dependent oxidoreductase [Loigolactobacillus iwatensis]|uniref:NADP-dependent oxidoreductase n=1 Tax=Loigolactobacillus iwatensis TaxID=1267156 RepID=UPI000F7D8BF8|nr:NADP-dependent oxidoreductase [Loigolactobacillus iwatensis]